MQWKKISEDALHKQCCVDDTDDNVNLYFIWIDSTDEDSPSSSDDIHEFHITIFHSAVFHDALTSTTLTARIKHIPFGALCITYFSDAARWDNLMAI